MAGEQSILHQMDAQVDSLFAGWSVYSTILALVLVGYFVYPLLTVTDADIHPFILARQATPSHVRQPGESAIYRSQEVPHQYPLRTGLNVKDPGAPKWTGGRDGDLRDIWRQAIQDGGNGKITSVKGKDQPTEQKVAELTKDINVIGRYIQSRQAQRVAIYLSNSVEFLVAFFAAQFYGFVPILVAQGQPLELLAEILRSTKTDILIAPAGTLSFQGLEKSVPSLKHIILVVEETSRHMDWNDDTGSNGSVAEWHEIIKKSTAEDLEIPASEEGYKPPVVLAVWQNKRPEDYDYEIVEYTQNNIVSAVAAQISVLPRLHHLDPADSVVSLDSLALIYPLTIVLAVLFTKGSAVLSFAAGKNTDYELAFQNVSPSIIVASTETLSRHHERTMAKVSGGWAKFLHSREGGRLAAGSMRKANTLLNGRWPRLIYTYERIGTDSTPLSPVELTDLRIVTGARIIYALTAAKVAGAISQTNMLDYKTVAGTRSHFGPPVSSVEIMLVDTPTVKISDDEDPKGEIVVTGPAVVGGKAKLGVLGTIGDDHTLSLI